MNIESMRTRSYRSFKVDDADLPEQARERLLAIRRFDELRAAGCSEQAAPREIGVSRRTMFRWKAALAASGQRGLRFSAGCSRWSDRRARRCGRHGLSRHLSSVSGRCGFSGGGGRQPIRVGIRADGARDRPGAGSDAARRPHRRLGRGRSRVEPGRSRWRCDRRSIARRAAPRRHQPMGIRGRWRLSVVRDSLGG